MSETKRPLKVFLCHASADKPKVRDLYRYLRKRGIKPWFDEMDLIGGQDWQIEIPRAIATSDAIIICLTKNSIDKEGYVQKEIKFALDKALEMPEGRIYLIPVRFEECEVPFSLSRYQWVDLFDEIGFTRLMKSLKTRAGQLERATVQIPKPDDSSPDFSAVSEEKASLDNAEHETAEKAELEAAEKVARDKAEKDALEKARLEDEEQARQKAAKEKAEHEAAEKTTREKAEKDAVEKARLEAEEQAKIKAAQEKAERESAEKAERERVAKEEREKAELEAAAKLALEKIEKEFERKREKIIKDARRQKLLLNIRYKLTRVRIYALPILFGIGAIAFLVYGFYYMPQNIPVLSSTPTSSLTLTLQPSITSTETFASTEIVTPDSTATKAFTPTPTLGIGSTMTSDKDGMVMVYMPEGDFVMGSSAQDAFSICASIYNICKKSQFNNLEPKHNIYLDSFWIDKTEVTNEMFKKCVDAGVCEIPPKEQNDFTYGGDAWLTSYDSLEYAKYPIVRVSWEEANRYCVWMERRLPTEAEWEKAARGPSGNIYPWGNDLSGSNLYFEKQLATLSPVGQFPNGASFYGVLDLAGSVWEWVSDWYDASYYNQSPKDNPQGPSVGQEKSIRGGYHDILATIAPSMMRTWADPNLASNHVGFRCARDANP